MENLEIKPTILVIDDRNEERNALIERLKDNFIIREAFSMEYAKHIISHQSSSFSMIITGKTECVELLKELNLQNLLPSVPVLMLAEGLTDEEVVRFSSMGIFDFIERPYKTTVLTLRLKTMIKIYEQKNNLAKTVQNEEEKRISRGLISEEGIDKRDLTVGRLASLLLRERNKNEFFANMSGEIQFEYRLNPSLLIVSREGEKVLGLPKVTLSPLTDEKVTALIGKGTLLRLYAIARKTSEEAPVASMDVDINLDSKRKRMRFLFRTLRANGEFTGVIGKLIDIDDEYRQIDTLRKQAMLDSLTELKNGRTAKAQINLSLRQEGKSKFALVMIDVDNFKTINDTYGHPVGDRVLKSFSSTLVRSLDPKCITARVGGDEFLCFFPYSSKKELEDVVWTLFSALNGEREGVYVSASIGVATTENGDRTFEKLFEDADKAMYHGKRNGKNAVTYYRETMQETSGVSTIEGEGIEYENN